MNLKLSLRTASHLVTWFLGTRFPKTIPREEADLDRVRDAIKKFSFRQQAGRHAGQKDRSSFLRKGQAGDWANHFTLEAAEIFDHFCGQMLIRTGYERDRSWVRSCGREASAADGVGQLTPAEQR